MEEKYDDKSALDSPDSSHHQHSALIKPQARLLHDPNVTFEEYHYYALQTREEEKLVEAPKLNFRELMLKKKTPHNAGESNGELDPAKNHTEINFSEREARAHISDEEWLNASRAFRTASWGACWYLITTDILGPYSIGFGLGTMGWGPGIALFTVFGFMAGYSGYLVWHVFLGLDSHQFPLRNYGDLAFRTWGTVARHVVNVIQALALLLLLGQVVIQFGQNISSVSKFRLCYIVCPLLFVIAGFCISQVRTLKNFGWFANCAVWLNLLAIFLTMGFISSSPPNHQIAVLGSAGSAVDINTVLPDKDGNYPPVFHYTGLPADGLVGSINGLLAGVLAYAGVQLFVEFLAEMKKPYDFIKAMWGAQLFIYVVYLSYGCFVYAYQGQYSFSPSYQGVSVYGWQTTGNMITLIGALIAAGLYSNIGIKVVYNNVLMDLFNAPPLITTRGKWLYAAIVPIWWSIAFFIAAAIPDFFGFVSVIAASTLLNLTYTVPPFVALGYDCQLRAGGTFDPITGEVTRIHSPVKRFMKGFMTGGPIRVAQNVWHVLYFLCSLAMCGLGMYAAVQGMIDVFNAASPPTSFSCKSPLNLAAQ